MVVGLAVRGKIVNGGRNCGLSVRLVHDVEE